MADEDQGNQGNGNDDSRPPFNPFEMGAGQGGSPFGGQSEAKGGPDFDSKPESKPASKPEFSGSGPKNTPLEGEIINNPKKDEKEASKKEERTETAEIPKTAPLKKPETVPGSADADSGDSPSPEVLSQEEEGFWAVLEQAGLNKRVVIASVLSILAFIVILVVLFFVIVPGFGSDDGGSDNGGSAQQQGQSDDDDDDSYAGPSVIVGSSELTRYAEMGGILTVNALGRNMKAAEAEFVEYVALLREMQNVYSTDIYELLDNSDDRRAALDAHIADLGDVIERGRTAWQDIVNQMEAWNADFEDVVDRRDEVEEVFFVSIQALQADTSYEALQTFIELEQRAAKLKADYNAYEALRDMYVNSINALTPRLRDVEANVSALLEGVRVFDIPDSDIEAIIRLGEE